MIRYTRDALIEKIGNEEGCADRAHAGASKSRSDSSGAPQAVDSSDGASRIVNRAWQHSKLRKRGR